MVILNCWWTVHVTSPCDIPRDTDHDLCRAEGAWALVVGPSWWTVHVTYPCDIPHDTNHDLCRAEGACTERYLDKDLTLVRCYVCNRMGHLCCTEAPQDPVQPSCYNCGDEGHLGTDCWRDKPNQASLMLHHAIRPCYRWSWHWM